MNLRTTCCVLSCLFVTACAPAPLEMSLDSPHVDVEDLSTEELVLLGTVAWAQQRGIISITLEMMERVGDEALARTWVKGIACAQPKLRPFAPRLPHESRWASESETALINALRRSSAPWTRDMLLCYLARWQQMRTPEAQAADFDRTFETIVRDMGQRGNLVNLYLPFDDAFQARWLASLCRQQWYSTQSSGGLHRQAVVWPLRFHPDADVRAAAELCFAR